MSFSRFRFVGALMAALMMALTLAGSARAQAQFGAVDFQRCIEESKVNQAAMAELSAYQLLLNQVLNKLSQGGVPFLAPAEIKELTAIYEKAQPSDAEKKRASDLESKADQKIGMMKRLESTNPLSEEQKKQISDLASAQQAGTAQLQEIQREYQGKLQDKDKELIRKVTQEVRGAVARIAKEKNLTMVFGMDQVIYAQVDITEDVLKVVK